MGRSGVHDAIPEVSNGGWRSGAMINPSTRGSPPLVSPELSPPRASFLDPPVVGFDSLFHPGLDVEEGGADGGDSGGRCGAAGAPSGDRLVVPEGEGTQRRGVCGAGSDGQRGAVSLLPGFPSSASDGGPLVGNAGGGISQSGEAVQVGRFQVSHLRVASTASGAYGGGDGASGSRDAGDVDRDCR